MTSILTHPVIIALGNALLNSMLQGLILFLIAAPLILLFGKRKPEVAHWISMAALTILLAGFTYSVIGGISSNPLPSPQAGPLSIESAGAASETASVSTYMQIESWNYKTLLPYIALMYVMGLLFFIIRFVAAFYNISLLRIKGLEKIPDYIHEIYLGCAEKAGITRRVNLFLSSRIKSPVCFGYLKPVILFPVSAITQLSQDEIEMIILHELAHIKRHDYLLKILQSTVQTILFFNPFCYFFSRQSELTRELCCDKMVIGMKNQKIRYAQTLLKLEEIKLSLTNPVLTVKPNQNQIMNRIKNIMENKPQNPLSRALSIALILISLAALSWYSVNTGNAAEPESKKTDFYLNSAYIQDSSEGSDHNPPSDSPSERKVVHMETTVFGEIKISTTDAENNNVRLTMKDGEIKYLGSDLHPYTPEDIASAYIHRPARSSDLHIIVNHESASVEKEKEQPAENKEESTKPAPDKGEQTGTISSETVKGTVADPQGNPMAGAAVRVQGTTQVSITGMDGTFTLKNVNASQTITVTFTGHEKFETQPVFDQPLEIRLKKDKTMPTVMVSLSDRSKDTAANENDRLANTLIFVDGREASSNIISTMNPSDIVSINVYKGEKAVEMFGERANTKEGVLYIVTREAGEKDPKTMKLEETISDDPDYGQMPFATTVEELPRLARGSFRDWISANMQYPEEAKEAGLEGTVLVEFIIRKDGQLEQIHIKEGKHPELFAEALRLVKAMPPWIPGKNQGEPVDVRFILPVEFVLN